MSETIAIVLYNFTATINQQLSVNVGDKVKVSPFSRNWFNATNLDDFKKNGLIPKTFVKIISFNSTSEYNSTSGNNSNVNLTESMATILKQSIKNTFFKMEFPYMCMAFCMIIFIIMNLFIFCFFKKKFNKQKKLNKRKSRETCVESFVESTVDNKAFVISEYY